MSETQDGHLPHLLPAELELALRSATWNALLALQSLRSAVREHVRAQSAEGVSREDIDDGLRSMIDSCGPALTDVDFSAEITKQVIKWSALFYRPKR